jgi:hypothetical protein
MKKIILSFNLLTYFTSELSNELDVPKRDSKDLVTKKKKIMRHITKNGGEIQHDGV